jgi:hypothetical protein|tara:strand:- start:313 stop:729 length:417 start_codon:yes stop_codon:yes gene_type:complete
MRLPHHLSESITRFAVTQHVVMVGYKRDDPRGELVFFGVMAPTVPEYFLGCAGDERGIAVRATGCYEVDLVVDVPVLEAALSFVCDRLRSRAFVDSLWHWVGVGLVFVLVCFSAYRTLRTEYRLGSLLEILFNLMRYL